MSTFPKFSNISDYIRTKLKNRRGSVYNISKLNPWVRITSGTGPGGLVLLSNPNYDLFKAAGSATNGIYGNDKLSGTVGTTWGGASINANEGQGYRPSPIVSSLEIDEGTGNLSRKASFTITAYSKEQMETLSKYFLEPGYSMFIEWGWNTDAGVSGLQQLTAENIAKYQTFSNTNAIRESSEGEYDNYLGFMTGGGITLNGDTWNINIKCSGYVELPAYLLASESGEQNSGEDATLVSAPSYGTQKIRVSEFSNNKDEYFKSRWMKAFNDLPKTRRTERIQALESELAKQENFINFDDSTNSKLNSTTDGWLFGLVRDTKQIGDEDVTFPTGTKITSDARFIKFSTLMRIFSEIGVEGYTLNKDPNKVIKFEINTKDTKCSAFPNIYSTKIDKLFIPNPKGPKFNLGKIQPKSKIKDIVTADKGGGTTDNSVKKSDGGLVQFPSQTTPTDNLIGESDTKTAQYWGYLDNLYVNFDFAKNILETESFFVKDALYQILNGMSSAVNGMWDFQIQENELKDENGNSTGVTQLTVHELNFVSDGAKSDNTYEFSLIGSDSIFIDSSFDMDISGAKMNQIIGRRLGSALNGDVKETPKTLFSDEEDLLGVEIKKKDPPKDPPKDDRSDDELIEDNLNILLGKLSFLPKVELTRVSTTSGDLYNSLYVGAFSDSNIFTAFKLQGKKDKSEVSPLMPINFSFSIHGISGIKRGDRFKVDGIPEKYKGGFFQVLSVKHTIDGMVWKTEVTGGFRR
jgi:hypothetical protein